MKFKQDFEVGIRELGIKNEITNYGFLAFLEDIATSHSNSVGYGIKDTSKKQIAWLILEWFLEVKKRPQFGEKVHVKTYAVKSDRPTYHVYRNFEVYDMSGELIATATSKWILFDMKNKKIVKLNTDEMNVYNPEEDEGLVEKIAKRSKEPDSYSNNIEYNVQRSDIDVNMHMNNLNYIKLAYETLPEKIFFEKDFKNVMITYKKQIMLGDKVKCLYSECESKHIVVIKDINEVTTHAIIELW